MTETAQSTPAAGEDPSAHEAPRRGRLEIRKRFSFEAAHYFGHLPPDHPNGRIHGHSFQAEITLSGEPDPHSGWITNFVALEHHLAALRDSLDHRTLNDIEGLEIPSLEHIAMWIAARLAPDYPALSAVTVSRPSCGESATYFPG